MLRACRDNKHKDEGECKREHSCPDGERRADTVCKQLPCVTRARSSSEYDDEDAEAKTPELMCYVHES